MFSRIAEKIIKQAMEGGSFEDLEGMGRPLDLELDANTPNEWRMAFSLLKNANMAPDWIELDKEIRTELEEARQELRLSMKNSGGQGEGWDRAVLRFSTRMNQLNDFLGKLNLIVPDANFQRVPLNTEEEIKMIVSAVKSVDQDEAD